TSSNSGAVSSPSASMRACVAAPAKARSFIAAAYPPIVAGPDWCRRGRNAATSTVGDMSCVFCAIVAGEAPAIRIYEDDDYLAILDVRPFTRGHTLVVPKRHSVDLTDTAPETLAGMVTLGQRIARAARTTELADATNIAINDGSAAFQTVFHIHLHVLPR